jgi:hypothetical protein
LFSRVKMKHLSSQQRARPVSLCTTGAGYGPKGDVTLAGHAACSASSFGIGHQLNCLRIGCSLMRGYGFLTTVSGFFTDSCDIYLSSEPDSEELFISIQFSSNY